MSLPDIKLTDDQKTWISETLNSYLNDEPHDDGKIILRCLEKISPDFDPKQIDERLYSSGELNIFGVYCLNNKHQLLEDVDGILKIIKEKVKDQQTFTAEELGKELNRPVQEIRVCLKLITHSPDYLASPSGSKNNEFGYSSIAIKKSDDIQKYSQYVSVDLFIEEMVEYRISYSDLIMAACDKVKQKEKNKTAKAKISDLKNFAYWKINYTDSIIEVHFADGRAAINLMPEDFGKKIDQKEPETWKRLLIILGNKNTNEIKKYQLQDINGALKKIFDTEIKFFGKNKPIPFEIKFERSKYDRREASLQDHYSTREEEISTFDESEQ